LSHLAILGNMDHMLGTLTLVRNMVQLARMVHTLQSDNSYYVRDR